MARQQITFYRSFWDAIEKLRKKDDRLSILEAVIAYGLDGEVRPMTDAAESLFVLIKPNLDAANRKSEGRRSQDRSSAGEEPGNEKNDARPDQDSGKIPARPLQNTGKENEREGEKEGEYKGEKESYAPAPARRKKHGQYGWVRLTPEEYTKLLEDLGEAELRRCIEYVDESAQGNGNKNRWKDWNLVIRKCHRDGWGLNRQGKPKQVYSSYTGHEGPTEEDYQRMQKLLKQFGGDDGETEDLPFA